MIEQFLIYLIQNGVVVFPIVLVVLLSLLLYGYSKSRRAFVRVPLLLVAFIVATVCVLGSYASWTITHAIRNRIASLSFTRFADGMVVHPSDYRGNVVLLNFWATWCMPCRSEMPDLNRIADAYAGKKVAVLALTDEDPEQVAKFEKKITPLRMTVGRFVDGSAPKSKLEGFAYAGRPTTVILDRDGNVRQLLIGQASFSKFDSAIRAAM